MKLDLQILNTILEGIKFLLDDTNSIEDINLSKTDAMSKTKKEFNNAFSKANKPYIVALIKLIDNILFEDAYKDLLSNKNIIVPLYEILNNYLSLAGFNDLAAYQITLLKNINNAITKLFGNEIELIEIKSLSDEEIQKMYKNYINSYKYNNCLVVYQAYNKKYIPESNQELKELVKNINSKEYYDLSLNWIDTSNITKMNYLFYFKQYFNGDISEWDTSNVVSMYSMFHDANNFSCDISKWNTSKVKDMRNMFTNARSFTTDISKWDVSSVTRNNDIFYGCHIPENNKPKFNYNIIVKE